MSPSQLLKETKRPEPPYQRIFTSDGATGIAEASIPASLSKLFEEPARLWQPDGEVLKPGSRSTVSRITLDGEHFVIKQYKALKLHRRLRYALSRTRARQSWENGQVMARLGIPVVRPIALIEETHLGIPGRSILIMPYQAGEVLSDQHRKAFSKIATSLHSVFSSMKRHQVTHGDMKSTNILIDQEDMPHLIDLDGSMVHSSARSFQIARHKDEARFQKNWNQGSEIARAFSQVFSNR